jgi:hypothetical protein
MLFSPRKCSDVLPYNGTKRRVFSNRLVEDPSDLRVQIDRSGLALLRGGEDAQAVPAHSERKRNSWTRLKTIQPKDAG